MKDLNQQPESPREGDQQVASRIYTLPQIQTVIATHPDHWRPLVLTNGCFDLLHAGHVRYLTAARKLGRSLVVGLNSDCSVQQIKPAVSGQPPRPIMPEAHRAEVIVALRPVDAVVIFSEPTAIALIQALRPDIYVKGGDYKIDTLPEVSAVNDCGGKVCLIPVELSLSTTRIIHQIVQPNDAEGMSDRPIN